MKKILSIVLAAIMVMALGVTAFAAEADTTLTDATFVKESGDSLAMGMGDGVIANATMSDDGMITVELKEYSRWLLITYTGSISSAYYVDGEGVVNTSEPLVTTVDGVSYLTMSTDFIEEIGTTGVYGIHLQLTFDMQPSTPPGMNSTMNAYFTCADFADFAE